MAEPSSYVVQRESVNFWTLLTIHSSELKWLTWRPVLRLP